jgi:hypothetical protein
MSKFAHINRNVVRKVNINETKNDFDFWQSGQSKTLLPNVIELPTAKTVLHLSAASQVASFSPVQCMSRFSVMK